MSDDSSDVDKCIASCKMHAPVNSFETTDIEQVDSIFLGLMGAPFDSDWLTTVFRLSEEILQSGKSLSIWTCGYSTQITQKDYVRSVDPIDPTAVNGPPVYTLTQMAQSLLRAYPDNLRWYVCQYCMEERGAINQIDGVDILLPFSFDSYLNQADKSLVLGVK